MKDSKIKSERPRAITARYHPVVNFLFRPIYKALGGRYNPMVAENTVGAVSFAFHAGLFSLISGGISDYMQEGDIKKIGVGIILSSIFPAVHYASAKNKNERLLEEKVNYLIELKAQGETGNLSAKLEEEFQRRREEYTKTPKFYTGFEPDKEQK